MSTSASSSNAAKLVGSTSLNLLSGRRLVSVMIPPWREVENAQIPSASFSWACTLSHSWEAIFLAVDTDIYSTLFLLIIFRANADFIADAFVWTAVFIHVMNLLTSCGSVITLDISLNQYIEPVIASVGAIYRKTMKEYMAEAFCMFILE